MIGDNFELIEFLWVRDVDPVVTGGDNLFESFVNLGDVASGDVGVVTPVVFLLLLLLDLGIISCFVNGNLNAPKVLEYVEEVVVDVWGAVGSLHGSRDKTSRLDDDPIVVGEIWFPSGL